MLKLQALQLGNQLEVVSLKAPIAAILVDEA